MMGVRRYLERWKERIMAVQSVRQEARRAAREAQAERRRERMLKEKRCEDLAVELAAALAERDRLVRRQEVKAASAVLKLVDDEGLKVPEVVELTGGLVAGKEVSRLRRLGAKSQEQGESAADGDEEAWQADGDGSVTAGS